MYYESRKSISEFEIIHNDCIGELNGGEINSREFNISNRKGITSDGSYYNIFKAISFDNNVITPGDGILFMASGLMNERCIDEYSFIGQKGEFLSTNLISHGVSSNEFKKSSFRYTTTIKTTPLTTNPDIDIAIDCRNEILNFLRQEMMEKAEYDDLLAHLYEMFPDLANEEI